MNVNKVERMKNMGKTMKKVVAFILSIALTLAYIMLPENNHEVSASVPKIYSSEVWDGTGSAVIVVDEISSDRFMNLTYENEEVSNDNYNVMEQDGSTVITFEQEYLQGLNLKSGDNMFMARFSGKEETCFRRYILLEGQNEIVIDRQLNEVVSKLTLKKSLSEEVDVDESDYIVTTTGESITITFKEEYLETLSEDSDFCVYGVQDALIWLNVKTDEESDMSQTTQPPACPGTPWPPLTDCVKPVPPDLDLPKESKAPVTQEAVVNTPEAITPDLPSTSKNPPTSICGDANADGAITLADAQMVLKAALKIDIIAEDGTIIDVQNISECNLEKAQLVLKAALKIISLEELEALLSQDDDKAQVPTGPAVEVPSGSAIEVPTDGAVEVPTKPSVEIPTGDAVDIPTDGALEVTWEAVEIDYAQIYIDAIYSYYKGSNNEFMAIDTDSLTGASKEEKDEVIAYFKNKGVEVKEASWEQLEEQGLISNPGTVSARVIGGVSISIGDVEITQNRIVVQVHRIYGALDGAGFEICFEVQDGKWCLVSKRVYLRA